MERLCHQCKPAKRASSTKTHQLNKEDIIQRNNQEVKNNFVSTGQLLCRDGRTCPQNHYTLHRAEFYGRVVQRQSRLIETQQDITPKVIQETLQTCE